MTVEPQKKTIKVFILLGQSNMVGMGKVQGENTDGTLEYAVKTKKRYPFLVEENGGWKKVVDNRVRNVFTMGSGLDVNDRNIKKNEWLTVEHSQTIGPEIGIGYILGKSLKLPDSCHHDNDDDIMVLKSCIGNRSLAWDLLPPGSPSFECIDVKDKKKYHYAAYKESPSRWEVGKQPKPDPKWYAGEQYDGDINRIKEVLSDLSKYIPDASTTTTCEIAGFFWWQGDKDRYDINYANHYKENLIRLIRQLRVEFASPDAKFVLATLGQTSKESEESKGADRLIFNAQMEVPELNEFVGNTSCVYSKPFCHGGASNSHYNHNAETYMDVGLEMGRVMTNLIDASDK